MRTLGKALLAALLGLGLLAASTPAFAGEDDDRGKARVTAPAKAKAKAKTGPGAGAFPKRTKSYDFDADLVNGNIVGPNGEGVTVLKAVQHTSLIKPRSSFVGEIVKSADDL